MYDRILILGRQLVRSILLLLHVVLGLFLQLMLFLLGMLYPDHQLERPVSRWWMSVLARLLGLRVRVLGEPVAVPSLVVANHVSWLDIPVLGGSLPLAFLCMDEVRRWPLLGWLVTMAGTVYISRGAHSARRVADDLIDRLRSGRNMAIFPEGTTSSGADVRRFLPRLFLVAVESGVPVQPVAIRYRHPVAPWVNNMPVGKHLMRVLGAPGIEVDLTYCTPIPGQGQRKQLAEQARQAIASVVQDDGVSRADVRHMAEPKPV